MKRFWLFSGYYYYPSGGMSDFKDSFDNINDAVKKADESDNDEWWEIVDSQSGEIVREEKY